MDLQRMLDKCRSGQWQPDDLNWEVTPRPMTRREEEAIVQYFVNMAAIERFAKALFEEQRQRVSDPTLKKIYSTFVVDEERHAVVAERLARHYDVHHYRDYPVSLEIEAFKPHFLKAIRYLSDEIANGYITGGEILLDVALLRSINDYVDDDMSQQAMDLINRDESRHIAIDFHMVEYYASDAYKCSVGKQPRRPLREQLIGAWIFLKLLRTGGPFFMQMFVRPMEVVDPSGRRLREAVKRLQLAQGMPGVDSNAFAKFGLVLRDVYNHPVVGRLFGPAIQKLVGIPHDFIANMYTEGEVQEARRRGFEWLANETLSLKYA
jgi:hypothetical protein